MSGKEWRKFALAWLLSAATLQSIGREGDLEVLDSEVSHSCSARPVVHDEIYGVVYFLGAGEKT